MAPGASADSWRSDHLFGTLGSRMGTVEVVDEEVEVVLDRGVVREDPLCLLPRLS